MILLNVKNRAVSTLASGIDDVVVELTLATGEGALFPDDNFHITIDDEIILCSSRSTDVLTIERGAEDTTPAAHLEDAVVELRITAGIIQELQIKVQNGVVINYGTFSDTLQWSNDDERIFVLETYVKMKEIKLNENMGEVRIKFNMRSTSGSNGAFGRIYKNGVAIGTERYTQNESYTTYSEDFTDFEKDDLIQFYGKLDSISNPGRVEDLKLCFAPTIDAINGHSLTTPLPVSPVFTTEPTNQDPV